MKLGEAVFSSANIARIHSRHGRMLQFKKKSLSVVFDRTKLHKNDLEIFFFTLESYCDFKINFLVLRWCKAIYDIKSV